MSALPMLASAKKKAINFEAVNRAALTCKYFALNAEARELHELVAKLCT